MTDTAQQHLMGASKAMRDVCEKLTKRLGNRRPTSRPSLQIALQSLERAAVAVGSASGDMLVVSALDAQDERDHGGETAGEPAPNTVN